MDEDQVKWIVNNKQFLRTLSLGDSTGDGVFSTKPKIEKVEEISKRDALKEPIKQKIILVIHPDKLDQKNVQFDITFVIGVSLKKDLLLY